MRAFHIPKTNAPAAVCNIPKPEPKPGEVRVKISACGLNFADLLMLEGKYQEIPDAPFTLGLEAAGVVDAIGEGAIAPPPLAPVWRFITAMAGWRNMAVSRQYVWLNCPIV